MFKNITVLLILLSIVVSGCKEDSNISDMFKDKNVISLINSAIDDDIQELNNLLSIGVDIDASGLEGITPLLWVVLHRDYDATEILLKAGADPNKASVHRDTALCIVAGEKNTALLKLLLKYKADPNCISRQNYSALTVALFKKRDKNIHILIDAGADIEAHNGYGQTVAVSAAALGRIDLVEYFLDTGYSYDLYRLRRSISTRVFNKESEAYEAKKRVLKKLSKYAIQGSRSEYKNKARGLLD